MPYLTPDQLDAEMFYRVERDWEASNYPKIVYKIMAYLRIGPTVYISRPYMPSYAIPVIHSPNPHNYASFFIIPYDLGYFTDPALAQQVIDNQPTNP